jgi:hypothetical protein
MPLLLLGCLLVFFDRWPPATRQAHSVRGPILQVGVEFSSTPADGFDMHSCDLRQQGRAAVSQLFGLQAYVPATLLFIQPTEQQVHLMVQFLVWMISRLLTIPTLTLMDRLC